MKLLAQLWKFNGLFTSHSCSTYRLIRYRRIITCRPQDRGNGIFRITQIRIRAVIGILRVV